VKIGKRQFAFLLILFAGATAGIWFSAKSSPAASEATVRMPSVPVGAAAASRRDVPAYLFGLGNVQAYNSVTIRAQIDGQITEIAFKEGQRVKTGDVLVKIDPSLYQANLDEAIAKKAQDQAQLDNSRRNLQRNAALIEKNFVARQDYDTNQARVEQFEAAVKGDEAAIENARVRLAYATIRSPLDGRVGIRLIDKGNIVHANETNGMVIVTQTQPINIVFTLPEQTLQTILQGMNGGTLPVTALSRDGKQQLDLGELQLIDSTVDQGTGTVRLKAVFANAKGLLWPGQFVTARLQTTTLKNALTIPVAAVQSGPNGSFAFIINKDGAAELRTLKLGIQVDDVAVIEAGLDAGDLVVTSGQYRLQPGTMVEVLPDSPHVVSQRD
jgi:multidrug efflux system membrane fusion protein